MIIVAPGAPTGEGSAREYVVVARRYRPQDFGELIGQQQVTQALCNAIATNRVGHAYLFTGARGVGKTSTARILSKALNCVNGPTATPCHQCDICQSISAGEDVDVLEIDGASNRGIDEIRQLRANVNVRPSRARFKIYIIDEVHMLTKEAFNALLKTLEEPPEHVKFIFCTTDPEKIPITVLSRCQRFDFPPVGTSSIVGRLRQIVTSEGHQAQEEALELLARRAAGSMRDSQSLLEQLLSFCEGEITVDDVHAMLGTAKNERIASLADQLTQGNAGEALAELDAAIHEGVNVGQLAEQLLGHVRDLLALSVGCAPELMLHNPVSAADAMRNAAGRWGTQTLLAVAQILDQTVGRMRHSVDPRVLLEIAVVRIASLGDLQTLSELIGQVRAGGTITLAAPHIAGAVASPDDDKKKTPVISTHASALATKPATAGPSVTHPSVPAPAASVVSRTEPTFTPQERKVEADAPAAVGTSVIERPAVIERLAESPADFDGAGMELTAGNIEQVWQDALRQLDGMVADFAGHYDRVALAGPNQLVVTFASTYNSAKSYCERPERMAQLENALHAVTGKRLRIDLVADETTSRRPQPQTRNVSTRDLVRQSYNHPFVKRAIEIFEGDVIRVQPAPPPQ